MSYSGYIYRNSLIHKMNPSLKFVTAILFIVMIFIPYGFLFQIVLFVIVMIVYFVAKLPIRKFLKIFQSILFMMALLLLINWIAYKGPGVVFDFENQAYLLGKPFWLQQSNNVSFLDNKYFLQGFMYGGSPLTNINISDLNGSVMSNNGFYIWKETGGSEQLIIDKIYNVSQKYSEIVGGKVSYEYKIIQDGMNQFQVYTYFYRTQWYSFSSNAIMLMLYVSIKIFLMILIVSILTSTTSSVELTSALEDILNPLRIFRLPINEWSTTIALSIRFIPSLLDESNKIMNAQASRGLDFSNGNIKEKIYSLSSLIVPLFSIAFRKADELANAMEARGYNPRFSRTRFKEFRIHLLDWIFFSVIVFLLGLLIAFTAILNKSIFFSPLGILEAIIMYK